MRGDVEGNSLLKPGRCRTSVLKGATGLLVKCKSLRQGLGARLRILELVATIKNVQETGSGSGGSEMQYLIDQRIIHEC